MSQIEHTLTAEHYEKIVEHETGWIDRDDPDVSLRQYYILHPLTLTFELHSPWRTDIENAPRNCTEILVDMNGFYKIICWYYHYLQWADDQGNTYEDRQITAWMEIPALPERI